jgi:hypothetical protein
MGSRKLGPVGARGAIPASKRMVRFMYKRQTEVWHLIREADG